MPDIHPTAVIDPDAHIAEGVSIGPFCVVGSGVSIGPGTTLRERVSICSGTTIGAENVIWPGTVLGGDPQDLAYAGEPTELVIGDRNHLRECVSISRGTAAGLGKTTVGSDNMLMAYAHLGHDGQMGDHNIITNSVQLAGHVKLENHIIIGGLTPVRQYATIGQYAFVAGATRVVRDVPPFMKVDGHPSSIRMYNDVGMRRHGFDERTMDAVKDTWRRLFSRGSLAATRHVHSPAGKNGLKSGLRRPTTIMEVVSDLESRYAEFWPVQAVLESIRNSTKGIHGRYLEAQRKHPELAAAERQ